MKLFPWSNLPSMKFIMLIIVKMSTATIVGILTFISEINYSIVGILTFICKLKD